MKKINLEKILYYVLIILSILIPLRELISLYISEYVKYIPDILVLALLTLYIVKSKFKIKLNFIDIFFLLFIGFGLISTLLNNSSVIAFIVQVRSIAVTYGLFYLLRKIPLTKEKYKNIFRIIFYTSIILIICAIGECLTNKELFYPSSWANTIIYSDNFKRVYGLLKNPNTFAIYLLLVLIMAYYFNEHREMKINPIYYFFSLTTIYLTGSRSTLVLLAIIVFMLFISLIIKKKYIKILIICLLLISSYGMNYLMSIGRNLIQIFYYSETTTSVTSSSIAEIVTTTTTSIADRVEETSSGTTSELSKVNGRIYNIELGLSIFKEHYIYGTGFGTFGSSGSRIVGSYLEELYEVQDNFYADNEYIKILVEVGIIGSLIYLCFIGIFGLMSLNNIYKFILFTIFIVTGLFYNISEMIVLMFLIYLFYEMIENTNKHEDLKLLKKMYFSGKENYYKKVKGYLNKNKKRMIITVNPETIALCKNDEEVRAMFNDKCVDFVPDGIGVVVGAKILHFGSGERITGVDLVEYLLEEGNKNKKSIFFFGSSQEVIDGMLKLCKEKYRNINVVGSINGYVNDKERAYKKIIKASPDICLVALGIPNQEKLIYKYLDEFDKGIFVGVGGSFDVLSGSKKRAPKIFQKLNLEWLYRIVKEPKRFSRFWQNNIKFLSDILNYER